MLRKWRHGPSYFGKRASGITFPTGAEGGGGFHNARNAMPPSSSKTITMTNATVTSPCPPPRSVRLVRTSPVPIDWCRLTIRLQDMLVPCQQVGKKSGESRGADRVGGLGPKDGGNPSVCPSAPDCARRSDGGGKDESWAALGGASRAAVFRFGYRD